MSTPKNTPYKQAQRKSKENRDVVLWRSNTIVNIEPNPLFPQIIRKHTLQGTYIRAIHGKLT